MWDKAKAEAEREVFNVQQYMLTTEKTKNLSSIL